MKMSVCKRGIWAQIKISLNDLLWTIATSKQKYVSKLWINISFFLFFKLKYLLKFWCLVIYKPFFKQLCTVIQYTISSTFFLTSWHFFVVNFWIINNWLIINSYEKKLLVAYLWQIMFKLILSCNTVQDCLIKRLINN